MTLDGALGLWIHKAADGRFLSVCLFLCHSIFLRLVTFISISFVFIYPGILTPAMSRQGHVQEMS